MQGVSGSNPLGSIPVRLLAPQGVFFVGQGVAGKPGGAKKRKIKRKTEASDGPAPGARPVLR